MKPVSRLLCSLALVFAAGAPHAAETAASAPEPAKGAAISTSVCAACHTNDGSRGSAANPIIQGSIPITWSSSSPSSRPASATTRS
jgi:mono/diheme cytochrome c family protein